MGRDARLADPEDGGERLMATLAEAVRKAVAEPARMQALRGIVRRAALEVRSAGEARRVWENDRAVWERMAHEKKPRLLDGGTRPKGYRPALQLDQHHWRTETGTPTVLPIWVPPRLHSSRQPEPMDVWLVRRGPPHDDRPFQATELLLIAAVAHDFYFRGYRIEPVNPWTADPTLDDVLADGSSHPLRLRKLLDVWYAHQVDQIEPALLSESEWTRMTEAVESFACAQLDLGEAARTSTEPVTDWLPTSLAATNRAARDLATNIRDTLGWFDALRWADFGTPPDPLPWWWDGYITDPFWKGPRDAPACREGRVEWANGRSLRAIDDLDRVWDRLVKLIPLPGTERPLFDAARGSLQNMHGILQPAQWGMPLRIHAIPDQQHLRDPLPGVWEPEPESDGERAAIEAAENTAYEVATGKGKAKAAAHSRLTRAKAKHKRLVAEREARNEAAAQSARRLGLVRVEQRDELETIRERWREQIERWRLCEKDLRAALARLTSAQGPGVETLPAVGWTLPPRPPSVQAAIDVLIGVYSTAQCVAVGIEEGRHWGWDDGDPKPLRPLPPREDFVLEERRRIDADGMQTWSPRHQADAEASWEDQREAHADWDRQRERCRQWRMVLLADWHELQTRLRTARDAVASIREPLADVVVHPGQWISEASALLGNLGALWVRWGQRPWVGDVGDLMSPLAELLQRCHYLQNAEFAPESGQTGEHSPTDREASESRDGGPGAAAAWMDARRTGAWIQSKTAKVRRGGLGQDTLRKAVSRNELKPAGKTPQGAHLYRLGDVASKWPDYSDTLRSACESESAL